jgi:hypothetical protein
MPSKKNPAAAWRLSALRGHARRAVRKAPPPARSEDSNTPNNALLSRLNLYLRRAVSYLHRRTSGKMRRVARLENALEILRLYYNFIRPHSSFRFGQVTRTPAMQAGLFDRPLTQPLVP